MARPKGGKGAAGTNAGATGPAPAAGSGAGSQPDQETFGGLPVARLVKMFPDFQGDASVSNVSSYLLNRGMTPDQLAAAIADADGGAEAVVAFVNQAKPPVAGEKPPAEQKPPKPPKPAKYPTPKRPPNIGPQLESMARSGVAGGSQGGALRDIEVEQSPDGTVSYKVTYYERTPEGAVSAVGAQTVDADGTVVAQSGRVPDQQDAAEGTKKPRQSMAQYFEDRPDFATRMAEKKKEIEDSGQDVPFTLPITQGIKHLGVEAAAAAARKAPLAKALAVPALAAGYGAYRMFSGTQQPPQQQPMGGSALTPQQEQEADQFLQQMGIPAPQATPTPQQNPAGTPQPTDSTLMRIMRSREYV